MYKKDPPGPQTTPPHNTPHIPDLIEYPVPNTASADQDVLLEALSTPVEMSQVNECIIWN